MSFYKNKLSKMSGIICATLIVFLFILQFIPYWTFEKTTIHVFSDANLNPEFRDFSEPVISDAPQPNRQAVTIKDSNDSINGVVWFPYKHEDTINHLHIKMKDKFKTVGSTRLVINKGKSISRGEFVSFFVDAFEITSSNTENFDDIKGNEVFAKNVAIARNSGLVDGIDKENHFMPSEPISRSDAMVVIYRILKDCDFNFTVIPEAPDFESYPDFKKVPEYAKEAMSAFFNAGIFQAKDGLIAPDENIAPETIEQFFLDFFPDRYGKFAGGTLVTPHKSSPNSENDNFEINSLALAIVIQQIFGLITLILLAFKSNTVSPNIFAFLHGVCGIVGTLICPALKFGNLFYIHLSISIATLLISSFSTVFTGLASRQKALEE